MAGLPKVAEIVENLSKAQTGVSEPEPSKAQDAESPEPTEETPTENNEPLAAAEDGPAKSTENRVPYDRFKEVNDKLKEAHETIAGFERRFQTLESASATASDQEETTQSEPTLSDKITQMIEDGEIGEGAATLIQEMAAKVDGQAGSSQFIDELRLERATKALGDKIDAVMKDVSINDERGAKMYLAQTVQNNPGADLSAALKAGTDWEGDYERKVLERHGVKPKGEDEVAESTEASAPKRLNSRGGGGVSSSGKSDDDEPMSLKQVRKRLTQRKRTGR